MAIALLVRATGGSEDIFVLLQFRNRIVLQMGRCQNGEGMVRLVLLRGMRAPRRLVVHMSMAMITIKRVWRMKDLGVRGTLQTLQALLKHGVVIIEPAQIEPILWP